MKHPKLFFFSLFTSACTLILIAAGGLVTSTGSGLSVPDWPLSYGTMFPPMIGGIRFEHSHRVIAGTVGILTLVLSICIWRSEDRRWVKVMAAAACASVLGQAILGGLTVIYLLPLPISVSHACLGQSFFALICLLTYVLSSEWRVSQGVRSPYARTFFHLAVTTAAFAFLQLIAGAVVRHTGGRLIAWHIFIAFFVIIHAIFLAQKVLKHRELRGLFLSQTLIFLALLALQVFLGLGAYLLKYTTERGVVPAHEEVLFATAHQTVGALILANFFLIALRAKRLLVTTGTTQVGSDYLDLIKMRVTLAALTTTFSAFALSSAGVPALLDLFHTLLGAFLVGGGGNALNQYFERDVDSRMPRTQSRPLPGGRLSPPQVLWYGWGLVIAGLVEIYSFVSPAAFVIALSIFVSYVFIYTPLKRVTVLNTFAGAVPGALPAVLGWIAAGGRPDAGALTLFLILFIWQIPHFYAIAWIYREDYLLGGLKMRSQADKDGVETSRLIAVFTLLLVAASALPFFLGLSGTIYLCVAMTAGLVMTLLSFRLIRDRLLSARSYVTGSVLYILAIFVFMVVDKR